MKQPIPVAPRFSFPSALLPPNTQDAQCNRTSTSTPRQEMPCSSILDAFEGLLPTYREILTTVRWQNRRKNACRRILGCNLLQAPDNDFTLSVATERWPEQRRPSHHSKPGESRLRNISRDLARAPGVSAIGLLLLALHLFGTSPVHLLGVTLDLTPEARLLLGTWSHNHDSYHSAITSVSFDLPLHCPRPCLPTHATWVSHSAGMTPQLLCQMAAETEEPSAGHLVPHLAM